MVFSPDGFASLPSDFTINDPDKMPYQSTENNGFLSYYNEFNSHWRLTVKAAYAKDHWRALISSFQSTMRNS
ncbi:MAG TPA: hypothetical protein ENO28_04165 [Bacteroidetes bacterium]|nr:hypothetical protein [Bacteroidota bacterium]